jgi:uncharacterized protein (TIGR02757 family)
MTALFDPEIAEFLETIYNECNRRQRLNRDPLAIVAGYDDTADREVAGLICSTLAFGSVDLILRACTRALEPLGSHPASALESMEDEDLQRLWGDFHYRFCFPSDMQALLRAIRAARRSLGSLEALFLAGDAPGNAMAETTGTFVRALRTLGLGDSSPESRSSGSSRFPGIGIRKNLLPDPSDGSACKRLFLYLRWMVRRDDIDPGGWDSLSPSRLIVPLDVHMAKTCRERLGFLGEARASGSPNLRDAIDVTRQFALYSPDDPVKYDFALTRPGIDPWPGDEVFGCF